LRILNKILRRAIRAIGLAEVGILNRKSAVVIKRRAPKHRAVRHHASARARRLTRVTVRAAASPGRHAQVTGIKKPDELGALALNQGTRSFGHMKLSVAHAFAW